MTLSKKGYQSVRLELATYVSQEPGSKIITLRTEGVRAPITLKPSGGTLTGGMLSSDGRSVVLNDSFPVELTYSKRGFVPQTLTVVKRSEEVVFNLAPAVGTLHIAGPLGATFTIGGKGPYSTPMSVQIPIGQESLTISASGYQSLNQQVSIYQDEVTKLDPVLETLASYRIRTAPDRIAAAGDIFLTKVDPDNVTLGAPRNQQGQRANETIREIDFTRQFYIGEAEISEEQYAEFAGGGASSKLPVVDITWQEAAKFCDYLSAKAGLEPFYITRNDSIVGWNEKSIGFRLPSEAEWEFAATKFTKRKERIFVWGDDFTIPEKDFGNIADVSADGIAKKFISDRSDGFGQRAPVGSFIQAGSIADLSGNVSEWVHDFYSVSIPQEARLKDFLGPSAGRQHFIKGSNYFSSSWTELRASYREPIDGSRNDVGFRIARYVH